MDEQKKYEVIKSLADHPDGNKDRAALILGCTKRHINRMIAGYRQEGRSFFVHGNRGRKPATTIPDDTRSSIIDLYRTKYDGANFRHFSELLETIEQISVSPSCVAKILEGEYILSPKATRKKKKRVKKELAEKHKNAENSKASEDAQACLVNIEDAHPRRPRCAYFGEMQQMDATPYEWIPGEVWHLHLAVDDATGRITGAWFDTQETLDGYYHVFQQILSGYGIPYKFLTDRRTVFTYKKKESPSADEDTYTQFAYACRQLGVQLESTSVPQAKGRVERLNQTLQSRLPVELRLAGIATVDAANEFLHSYIEKFNEKFSLPLHGIKSVFEMQPESEKINLTLAVLTERTVDCGHALQFQNSHYRMLDTNGKQVCYRRGTKAMVIRSLDGRLFCCVNDKDTYALERIPEREEKSKELDADYQKPAEKKHYVPPMSHPWRLDSFRKFLRSQPHRTDDKNALSA